MATSIATVLAITGQAWARDTQGNLRVLKPGEVLLEGEEVLTSDNGRAQLELANAKPIMVGPNDSAFMLADMSTDGAREAIESNDNIEALLSALEQGEEDLLEVLPAPTAGFGPGGIRSGHSFVRLERINQDLESLSLDTSAAQLEPLEPPRGRAGNGFDDQTIADDLALANDTQVGVNDSEGSDSSGGTVAGNSAPRAVSDAMIGQEDSRLTGNVLTNDSDVDADSNLSVNEFIVDGTAYQAGDTAELDGIGSLSIAGDGSYTFTPLENWNGQVPEVSYTVTDGELSDSATLDLTVVPTNDAPIAQVDSATGDEDTTITGNVLTNDSDLDNESLNVSNFQINGNNYEAGQTAQLDGIGSFSIASDGSYTFTPDANWNGQVPAVSYTVTDGELTDTAELQLTVSAVNDAPVAEDDAATGSEDAALTGNVLANDSDIEGDTLAVSSFTIDDTIYQAGETAELNGIGSLTVGSDGSYTFTPIENWNGQVPPVSYTVTDGELTDTAKLNLAVLAVNDAPVAEDDAATGSEDTQLTGNVLANDNDVDADSNLSVNEFIVDGTAYQAGETAQLDGIGSLSIGSNGSYTFTPVENWNDQVPAVSYTVTDGELTDTAELNLAVSAVNDAPIAEGDSVTGDEDTVVTGNVLANDRDVDADSNLSVNEFTVDSTAYQAGETAQLDGIGSLSIGSNGSYTFTPIENWNGQVPPVSYTVTDGELTDTAKLNLAVLAVNDAPVAEDDAATGSEDTQLTGNVLANDNDVDADSNLSISGFTVNGATYQSGEIAQLDGVGSLSIASDGSYTFTPIENWNGQVPAVSYTVTDGELTDTAKLNLAVLAVNDAPVAEDDAATGSEDTQLTGNVLANDNDV
ncbi:retention module-containing protein, partial [Halomonas sp. GXIMD04776]|uniref:retention module-containing protein n=1 Tax=Halomonas sp. GXIMD04776 TaxID=3415605 RepID=UPI003CB7865F